MITKEHLDDPWWRITSGEIYKIIVNGDDDSDDGLIVPFKPNDVQLELMKSLWHRNVVLKARQRGITTLIAIMWLDTALFSNDPIQCGIIAQDKDAVEIIFRHKVKFAYDHLPKFMQAQFPLIKDSAREIQFAHNLSSVRVATSMRSGTIHRLHISEFGKICAKYPDKAQEVITGSIPAVPKSGILVIESTAEGQEGEFYKITKRALDQRDTHHKLSIKDYRFHFYSWWDADEYEIDPENVLIDEKYLKHFYETEAKIGHVLSEHKRAWYVATCESDFSGDMWKMRQEYPSTPEEAFQISTDGKYFAEQMSAVRKTGRILPSIPVLPVPINTFWDIGKGDMTAIWFHQFGTLQHRFINYYENSGEDLITYVRYLQLMASERGYVYGKHYIPHESDHKRIGATPDTSKSIKEMLEDLYPGQRFEIVPRVTNKLSGIMATRAALASAVFDETNCGQGIKRLDNYKKRWVSVTGSWANEPLHDENSHGADAMIQWGQEVGAGNMFDSGKSKAFDRSQLKRSWR